jgi:hypothetical protein
MSTALLHLLIGIPLAVAIVDSISNYLLNVHKVSEQLCAIVLPKTLSLSGLVYQEYEYLNRPAAT